LHLLDLLLLHIHFSFYLLHRRLLDFFFLDFCTIYVDLSKQELIEALHNFFLRLTYLKLCGIESDGIGLTAWPFKIEFIGVLTAPTPSAIHQFLIVDHAQFRCGYTPLKMPGVLLLAIPTIITSFSICMTPLDVDNCFTCSRNI
jgi:hypothetical protein